VYRYSLRRKQNKDLIPLSLSIIRQPRLMIALRYSASLCLQPKITSRNTRFSRHQNEKRFRIGKLHHHPYYLSTPITYPKIVLLQLSVLALRGGRSRCVMHDRIYQYCCLGKEMWHQNYPCAVGTFHHDHYCFLLELESPIVHSFSSRFPSNVKMSTIGKLSVFYFHQYEFSGVPYPDEIRHRTNPRTPTATELRTYLTNYYKSQRTLEKFQFDTSVSNMAKHAVEVGPSSRPLRTMERPLTNESME
jgi:hypothetical protein